MNVLLIAANVIIYVFSHPIGRLPSQLPGLVMGNPAAVTGLLPGWETWMLLPQQPTLMQFFTYQFLHENLSHIFFNMLFLYVFGNNLNEKLGHVGYLAFYLAGGVLAGCGQMLTSTAPTLGASGAISAVTGLFLVLLPRTYIRMFFSLFFLYVDIWEIPSMYFILFKIGDDVFEQFTGGPHVAYMAHLTGAFAGILIGLLLLFTHLVQRDHYDLLALFSRYRRRKSYEAMVSTGYDPFNALRGSRVLQTGASAKTSAEGGATDPRIESLRNEISRLIRLHELPDAVQRYLELRAIDPAQVMSAEEQLDLSNQLMAEARYSDAAGAYEDYLRVYPTTAQHDQIMLILGLIYSRYLPKPERARQLFRDALPRLHDAQQREMAEAELQRLGDVPPPQSPPAVPA
jgi:membrane associated rhomboid family serine protease